MSNSASKHPVCVVIAGPNGAGKTTFAREFLLKDAGVIHFVNADLIAGGLSPLRPELAMLSAGRIFLGELDRLAKARADFAFETTLSGLVGGVRQFRDDTSPAGGKTMKPNNKKKSTKTFAAAVGGALRRAGKAARKTARAHGTAVYVWQDGKVVAQKP